LRVSDPQRDESGSSMDYRQRQEPSGPDLVGNKKAGPLTSQLQSQHSEGLDAFLEYNKPT